MSDAGIKTGAVADPDLSLRGPLPRVMRLSRRTIAIAGATAAAAIGGASIWALQHNARIKPPELYDTDSRPTADAVVAAPKDYGSVPKLGPPLPGDLGKPILDAQRGTASAPLPVHPQSARQPSPAELAAEQARRDRDAARASALFAGDSKGGASSAAAMTGGGESAPPATPSPAATAPGTQAAKRAFMRGNIGSDIASDARLLPAAGKTILQAGSMIPAALITGIRSDLPGQVSAQVTEPVRDSLTGRKVLIPQGSRLIGEYDSDVSFGQARVLLVWTRLILPDGRSLVLERLPATDVKGQSGLSDGIDRHWGAMLKAALVSTLLGAGTEVASDDDDRLVRALQRGTARGASDIGNQLVGRQLDVQPTLTIRPGYPVRVFVTRDLVFD